ncbi:AslB/AtsB family protein [uncultured Paludibacter sp.]|nr:AslB/AtsB family protein [uncultured Paludibacter sp.]
MKKTTLASFLNKAKTQSRLTVIFQLTDKCVLSCRYCFAKDSYHGLDVKTLNNPKVIEEAIIQSFKTRHKEVEFEWTGGESFLAGINFYKRILKVQKKYATKKFYNSVQTSGYLFDKDLIDFFVANHFSLSVTIDGTADVHNFNRPANGKRYSLNKILATREYIIEKQGYCGFISTITKKSIGNEADILHFFRSLGVNSFHSNPYIYFSKNTVKDETIALTNCDYATYFINQFNAWFEQGEKIPIPKTIHYILQSINSSSTLQNTICTFGGRCIMNFIAITPYGDAYICPKFIGLENMLLGNITNLTIAEILSEKNPLISKIINDRISAINNCEKENCKFIYLCNGGCPYYSLISSDGENIREKDCLCYGKKLVYKYLENVLETINHTNM